MAQAASELLRPAEYNINNDSVLAESQFDHPEPDRLCDAPALIGVTTRPEQDT